MEALTIDPDQFAVTDRLDGGGPLVLGQQRQFADRRTWAEHTDGCAIACALDLETPRTDRIHRIAGLTRMEQVAPGRNAHHLSGRSDLLPEPQIERREQRDPTQERRDVAADIRRVAVGRHA